MFSASLRNINKVQQYRLFFQKVATMPSNIEIKAHYDEDRFHSIKDQLGPVVAELNQVDTFFKTNHGRLKLRQEVINGTPNATLIGYSRTDDSGPSRSTFTKTKVANPSELQQILESTIGVVGVVKKQRRLYHVTDPVSKLVSRVHIDVVEGLGRFLELEVLLRNDSDEEAGIKFAHELTETLKISDGDLLSTAYMDMINAQETKGLNLNSK